MMWLGAGVLGGVLAAPAFAQSVAAALVLTGDQTTMRLTPQAQP